MLSSFTVTAREKKLLCAVTGHNKLQVMVYPKLSGQAMHFCIALSSYVLNQGLRKRKKTPKFTFWLQYIVRHMNNWPSYERESSVINV